MKFKNSQQGELNTSSFIIYKKVFPNENWKDSLDMCFILKYLESFAVIQFDQSIIQFDYL